MAVARADGTGVAGVDAMVEAKVLAQVVEVDQYSVGTVGMSQAAQEVEAHLPKAAGRDH